MSTDVVAAGKLVTLTYSISDERTGLLEQNDLPVSYIPGGAVELVGGMDQMIDGRRAGEEVEFTVTPEHGFGDHDPSLTFTDAIENVPPEFRFVGAEVQMESESGEVRTFYVTRIENGRLTVDGNHPFAGKTLKVRVRIIEVREPTADELTEAGLGAGADRLTH